MSAQIFVGMGINVKNFTIASMRKRCKSELRKDSNKTFTDDVVVFDDLVNDDYWTVNYTDSQKCDTEEDQCKEGYVYSSPEGFHSSFKTMEYSLKITSCDSSKIFAMATSFYFIGLALGPLFGGILADNFGRKPTCLFFGITTVLINIYLSYTESVLWYSIGMFYVGFSVNGFTNINILLVQELLPNELRFIPGMLNCVYTGVSYPLNALVAYNFDFWYNSYQFTAVFASLVMIFLYFFLPESSRWLVLNKPDKIAENEEKMMFYRSEEENEKQEKFLKELVEINTTKVEKKSNLMDLFKSKMLMKRALLSIFLWSTANIVYYGFIMNLNSLTGSIYLNASFNCIIEIFGYVVIPTLFINRLGRIKCLLIILSVMMSCTVSGLLFNVLNLGSDTIIRWMGALGVCALFVTINTHTAECFPTNLRGQGLSIPDGTSRLTAVVTPFFGILYKESVFYYWMIHIFIILVSICVVFCLPETSIIYPDTKEDCRKQKSLLDEFGGSLDKI